MNNVEIEGRLMHDILMVTVKIQIRFPELYELLSETPLFLYSEKEIKMIDFENYLDSLKVQLIIAEKTASFIRNRLVFKS